MLWLASSIAAVSNLDNLAAGVAYGIRRTRISAAPNLIIALITMAATAAAMTSGRALSELLPAAVANSLGAVIIIAIGAWTLLAWPSNVRARARAPLPGSARFGGRVIAGDPITLREALTLGVALSLNNLGTGIGAGVARISPLETTLLAGLFSLLAVGAGSSVGRSLTASLVGNGASLVAGVALVGVGLAMLLGVG